MNIYSTATEAEAAAPVGHYVMFRDGRAHQVEWRVMTPAQRDESHANDAGHNAWRTWARKERT